MAKFNVWLNLNFIFLNKLNEDHFKVFETNINKILNKFKKIENGFISLLQ